MTRCPHLPPEISDLIVDLLRYECEALKQCCLVSRSWVPSTRKHLFAKITFRDFPYFVRWRDTFPDPTNSPAYLSRALSFGSMQAVEYAVAEGMCWTRAFRNVVLLELRDVCVVFSFHYLQLRALIHSLPLLEDLYLIRLGVTSNRGKEGVFQPQISPPFTGTLITHQSLGIGNLLPLVLNGIRFLEFEYLRDFELDIPGLIAFLEACSDTLENVVVGSYIKEDSSTTWIDFSRATKLKGAVFFRSEDLSTMWITAALKTITPKHRGFRDVTIHMPFNSISCSIQGAANLQRDVGEEVYWQWMDLDNILSQLCESHGVRVLVRDWPKINKREVLELIEGLLPETAKRESTRLVD